MDLVVGVLVERWNLDMQHVTQMHVTERLPHPVDTIIELYQKWVGPAIFCEPLFVMSQVEMHPTTTNGLSELAQHLSICEEFPDILQDELTGQQMCHHL